MVYAIKRMDKTGHTVLEHEDAISAANCINEQRQDGYIAYLNGQLFSGERVTHADLAGVDNIVLSTPIRGG